jgi:hypothetical protein
MFPRESHYLCFLYYKHTSEAFKYSQLDWVFRKDVDKMKYCEYCNSENKDDDLKCHWCGAPFSDKTIYRQAHCVEETPREYPMTEAQRKFILKFSKEDDCPVDLDCMTKKDASLIVEKICNRRRIKERKGINIHRTFPLTR